jgi:hypothetical protein
MRFFIATLLSAHNIVAQESFMADEVFMSVAAWAVMHHDARLLFSFIARRCVVCLCFSFATFFFLSGISFATGRANGTARCCTPIGPFNGL